ncbi:hypothetical protein ACGFYZ_20595 [Streptomyces sp. NPDC048330]|uniref:hypothetical protein n=1 Tax=Streptomyces sp. NPDC048330 TaxID=3365533 RepID=UPI003721A3E8
MSTFGGSTASPDETGCGRCFDEDEVALLRTPHAPLPADLVRRVTQKDPHHWDDQPAIIRRTLPQLVTLLADGERESALMARGLAAAGWSHWPREQAEAVSHFLKTWWIETLRRNSPPIPACEVLATCAIASSSVTPWLTLWQAETGPVAHRHMCDTLDLWSEELTSEYSPFTWWWGPEAEEQAAWNEVKRWLTSPRSTTTLPLQSQAQPVSSPSASDK